MYIIYNIKKDIYVSLGICQSFDLSRRKIERNPSIILRNINVLFLVCIKESFSSEYLIDIWGHKKEKHKIMKKMS